MRICTILHILGYRYVSVKESFPTLISEREGHCLTSMIATPTRAGPDAGNLTVASWRTRKIPYNRQKLAPKPKKLIKHSVALKLPIAELKLTLSWETIM
jgi:hypothetical protein